MRKLLLAVILLLLFSTQQSYSIQPRQFEPVPKQLFRSVVLPSETSVPQEPSLKPNLPEPKPTFRTILSGQATWYCKRGVSRCTRGYPSGYYAAIRKDLLALRGKTVLVCAKKCIRVKIIDCNCGPHANLIDLYWDAFNAISDPSLGRIRVTVKW